MSREAIEFIHDFFRAEHDARVAIAVERDDAAVQARIDRANTYFGAGLDSGLFIPDRDEEYYEQMAEQIEEEAPRPLFIVRSYRNPALGEIHRCYAGNHRPRKPSFFYAYYVMMTDGGMKIVSRYIIRSQRDGWDWSGGASIKVAGEQTGVERLQPPVQPNDLADYEADEATY